MREALLLIPLLLLIPVASAASHVDYPSFSAPEHAILNQNTLSVNDDAIYEQAWYASDGDATWMPFTLQGTSIEPGSPWLTGQATTTLPPLGSGEHYVITYSCTQAQGAWDCHGNDAHPEGYWQLLVLNSTTTTEPFVLVQDKAPVADIVVAPEAPPMVQLAAQHLQFYLHNMSGATLPISHQPDPSYGFHVYVGRSQYTDALGITDLGCKEGGYKIQSGEDYLVLLGDDKEYADDGPSSFEEWDQLTNDTWDNYYLTFHGRYYNGIYDIWENDKRGSMNAVYEFLYRQGIRWYYPGTIGTIVPQKNAVASQPISMIENPEYALRNFFFYYQEFSKLAPYRYPDGYHDELLRWQMSLRENHYTEVIGARSSHGILPVISRPETVAEHPEYYAIWDGVRQTEDIAPDLCSQGLLEENVRYVKAMIDIYNATMVNVMPTDGFRYASESSPECKAKETPERGAAGLLSDYVWDYVNNVAWEIYNEYGPERKILCGAYTGYLLPPVNLSRPVAPNLAVKITKWRSHYADEQTEQFYRQVIDDWLALLPSKELYTYDYYLHNRPDSPTESIPSLFPHLIARDMQYLQGRSSGEMVEVNTDYEAWNLSYDPFAANALNTWLTARLYWDPNEDVDALLEEYYDLYYGPARDEMKAFVEYSEANYNDAVGDPIILQTMRTMAKDALSVAGRDTIYGQRIEMLLKMINSTYVADTISLSDCSALTSPSTTYLLETDVSSPDTCMVFDADGATLDCQGHSITFSTDGEDKEYGIDVNEYLTARGDYFNITNCVILDGATSSPNIHRYGIRLYYADHGTISNTTIDAGYQAVHTLNSNENLFIGNHFEAGEFGLTGQDTSRNEYVGNTIIGNTGMSIYQAHNNTIRENELHGDQGFGLKLTQSEGNLIVDNYITSHVFDIVFLYQLENATLINNTVVKI